MSQHDLGSYDFDHASSGGFRHCEDGEHAYRCACRDCYRLAAALRLLQDFATLKAGDMIIHNGANGMVGQVLIQLAAGEVSNAQMFLRLSFEKNCHAPPHLL